VLQVNIISGDKEEGYEVSGKEERGLQNNLIFSISPATPKRLFFVFFFFEKI
jgi:hypothetical protein